MTKWCENDLPSMLYMSVFYCTFAFAIMLPNVSVGFLLSVSIYKYRFEGVKFHTEMFP